MTSAEPTNSWCKYRGRDTLTLLEETPCAATDIAHKSNEAEKTESEMSWVAALTML